MARRPREELILDENALIDLECVICLELPPGRASQVFANPPPHMHKCRVTPANAQRHLIDRPRRIAQCFDGHVLCAECMHKHRNSNRGASSRRCPSCRNPLGQPTIRNRALETVIGCIEVQCPFQFGLARCDAHLRRKDLDDHMSTARSVHLALLDAAQADAIVPVVALISDGVTGGARAAAAEAVQHLALNNCHRLAIVKAGAVAPLRVLLGGACGEWGAWKAAMALHNIVFCAETIPAIVEADVIPPLVRLLGRGEATRTTCANSAALAAARALESLVTRGTEATKAAVAEAGAIAALVALLRRESQLAIAAARVLANLGMCTHRVASMNKAGAIASLAALLCGTDEVTENAAKLLGIICCLTSDLPGQVAIAEAGVVALLVALLRRSLIDRTHRVAYAATLALGCLMKFPDHRNSIARAGAKPLVELLSWDVSCKESDYDAALMRTKAAKLLHELTDCTENTMAMIEAGVVNQLLALLGCGCVDAIIKVEVATLLHKLTGAINAAATEALRAA